MYVLACNMYFLFQVTQLTVVPVNCALRLRADRDFTDDKAVTRVAGDEWLFEGPGATFLCVF